MILRALYLVIIFVCILPTLPGLLGVMTSALGYIPPIGLEQVSLAGFAAVFHWSGVWHSIGLTIGSALVSSYLACFITFVILQSTWRTRFWRQIEISLSPLLAMPHVAFAIGFAFLFSPTGMVARLWQQVISLDGSTQNVTQGILLIKDPNAFGLVIMLALKEVPFLLLMSIPILQQLNIEQSEKVSQSMGYSPNQTWWKCIFPQWFSKLRFSLFAVIAYSLSVVDVALIIGPTNPPTFAVLVWQWFNDPDLSFLPRAAAGAIVLFAIASLLVTLARLVEWLITTGSKTWQYSGRSGVKFPGKGFFATLLGLTLTMIPILISWSFAQRWRFPDLLPSQYTNRFWQYEWQGIISTIEQSLMISVISASISLLLALIAHEYRLRHRWQLPSYVIAIPMLIPQLSVLLGMQIVTLYFHHQAYFFWVCWAHVFFAFPFVYLSLDGPWRSFNQDLMRVALSLGKTPLQAWLKIKLPLLLPAIIFAWAIGVSVSLAQYLPTLMLGAGRITTLTTEAVALSSGFDRRITAIYALWQALLPLIFFCLALLLSRLSSTQSRRLTIKGFLPNESLPQKPHHT